MILVTGGAGFIGSCFVKKLNDNGIKDIFVVDHLGNGQKWKNLVGKQYQAYEHKADFRKLLNSGEFKGRFEAIFHFGACSVTTEKDADYMMDNNFNYSRELAEFAIDEDIRFIYASSAATYGAGENGYSDRLFDELKPLNVYGYSKQLFDLWAIEKGYDKIFTGLKFFNVFGPNEYHKGDMASMVYKSYFQIKETGRVNLFRSYLPEYTDGGQKRDFVYVKDVCDIMWLMYQDKSISGIYNLGAGKAQTWNELISAVFKALGKETNIEYIDMPESLKGQYQYYTKADMGKMQEIIPGLSFKTLEENVADYVCNHLEKEWKNY